MPKHVSLLIIALLCLNAWTFAQEDLGSRSGMQPAPQARINPEALRSFHTIFVRSETVYMKSELLQGELRLQPEYSLWGLKLVLNPAQADTIIEVHRPFLTFDWDYKLLDRRSGQELVSGTVVASEGHRAAERIAADLMKQIAPVRANDRRSPQNVLSGFRTMYVESHTIYLKTELIQAALSAQPALALWGVELVPERNADVVVTIHRPFMSFDWEFKMRHPAGGQDLGSGSIVAWDGPTAAPLLASMIITQIGGARTMVPSRESYPTLPANPETQHEWRVRLQSGYGLHEGAALLLSSQPDRLVLTEAARPVLSIPVRDVLAITHSTAPGSPAMSWWTFRDAAIPADASVANSLVLVPALATSGAAPETPLSGDHYVSIVWRDSGRLRRVELTAHEGTCKAMLADLQSVTHQSWRSLPEEVQGLRASLQRGLVNAVPVEFDRSIRVGWTALPAGTYRLVTLESQPRRAEVYLFAEGATADRVAAQAVVEVLERPASTGTVQVTYKEENGITSLAEIRTGPKTLRFSAVPLAAEE